MPLFMEFHKMKDLSMDLEKLAKLRDSIPGESKVKVRQFWINEEAGTVFSLMEGPDKLSCEELYGSIFRTETFSFMHVSEYPTPLTTTEADILTTVLPRQVLLYAEVHDFEMENFLSTEALRTVIRKYEGIALPTLDSHSLFVIFSNEFKSCLCAVDLYRLMRNDFHFHSFQISLQRDTTMHEGRRQALARRLCSVECDSKIVIPQSFNHKLDFPHVRYLTPEEEKLLTGIYNVIDDHLCEEGFNVEALCKQLGMSRPQLYRKVQSMTGRSPNNFLRDLRMQHAIRLLRQRTKNICEVALEVGYANPSYFTRTFFEKYGCVPSQFLSVAD